MSEEIKDETFGADKNHPDNKTYSIRTVENPVPKKESKPKKKD